MPGLASNTDAAKSWNKAKQCLTTGDVHGGYAAFSTAKRILERQIAAYSNKPESKYLWRATSIEAKQVSDELLRMSAYFKESHYATLAIPTTTNLKGIKKAYRNLARKYHPDKNRDTNELFVLIKTSYDVLSDTTSKSRYDRSIRAKEEAREHANIRARATSGIGNPRGMKTRKANNDNKNKMTAKKQKEVQSHIAKELKRAWKFVKMQQAQFEAAQEKERMRRYAQEKAEEKARARAEARRQAAQQQQDNKSVEKPRNVANDINNIKERVMNKLYGCNVASNRNVNNLSYEGSKTFFGEIFGENNNNNNNNSKQQSSKMNKSKSNYNRSNENPMTASSNYMNNKTARVYDDGIRVRAGTDTSTDYETKSKINFGDRNNGKAPVKIFDDGIRVRPVSVDPYEKIEKSRSKKSVFNSHVKEKITKDASSKNRSEKTKHYENNKPTNFVRNVPSPANIKQHQMPIPPTKMQKKNNNNSERPSLQSRVTSSHVKKNDKKKDNANKVVNDSNSNEKRLFKYSVIKGKDLSNNLEKNKNVNKKYKGKEQNVSNNIKLPPVNAKKTDESNTMPQQHSEKDFVEEVRRMWRDAVTEAVGLGTDAKFLKRIVEKEKIDEIERKRKNNSFARTSNSSSTGKSATSVMKNDFFECKKCGENIKVENVLDHTQGCMVDVRIKNKESKPKNAKNGYIPYTDGNEGSNIKKKRNMNSNQKIMFPTNNETFECKNCKNKVLFVHAIDHASKCVRLQQTLNEGNNDVAAGTFWGSKNVVPEGMEYTQSNSSSDGMDSHRSYDTNDENLDSFYDDDDESFSSGDSDDDDDPLLDNPNIGMFWGGMNKPEVVEPSGFFSADGIFHVSPTSNRSTSESELQKVLKEIPLSKNKKMPRTFVQF
jgi:curved DNA-binding protein CbpA